MGGLLLEHAERFARAAGFSCLAVNSGLSRLPAHAFYEKQGFVKKAMAMQNGSGLNGIFTSA